MNVHPHLPRVIFTRIQKQSPFLASALAMLVLTSQAHAGVVLSPAASIAVPLTTDGVYVNVVSGKESATSFVGWNINPWGTPLQNSALIFDDPANLTGTYVVSSPGQVASLAIGSEVGFSANFGAGAASTWTDTSYWLLNATNYFGFDFIDELDGSLHYGYGTMIIGSSLQTRTLGNIYYENVAGAPITVGAVPLTAVPEPASLGALLSGLAVLFAVRRGRSKDAGSASLPSPV